MGRISDAVLCALCVSVVNPGLQGPADQPEHRRRRPTPGPPIRAHSRPICGWRLPARHLLGRPSPPTPPDLRPRLPLLVLHALHGDPHLQGAHPGPIHHPRHPPPGPFPLRLCVSALRIPLGTGLSNTPEDTTLRPPPLCAFASSRLCVERLPAGPGSPASLTRRRRPRSQVSVLIGSPINYPSTTMQTHNPLSHNVFIRS